MCLFLSLLSHASTTNPILSPFPSLTFSFLLDDSSFLIASSPCWETAAKKLSLCQPTPSSASLAWPHWILIYSNPCRIIVVIDKDDNSIFLFTEKIYNVLKFVRGCGVSPYIVHSHRHSLTFMAFLSGSMWTLCLPLPQEWEDNPVQCNGSQEDN